MNPNQPINPFINQKTKKPIKQITNELINQLINQTFNKIFNQKIKMDNPNQYKLGIIESFSDNTNNVSHNYNTVLVSNSNFDYVATKIREEEESDYDNNMPMFNHLSLAICGFSVLDLKDLNKFLKEFNFKGISFYFNCIYFIVGNLDGDNNDLLGLSCLEMLNLKNNNIENIDGLVNLLKYPQISITQLNLSNNYIEDVSSLFDILPSTKIVDLELQFNKFGNSKESIDSIIKNLPRCNQLQHLDIYNSNINEDVMTRIVQNVIPRTHLKLYLCWHTIVIYSDAYIVFLYESYLKRTELNKLLIVFRNPLFKKIPNEVYQYILIKNLLFKNN